MPNNITNNEEYEVVEIMGIIGLFTNERMHSGEIPKSVFKYDLRYDDYGEKFASIEDHVMVNHGGTFLSKEPINLGECGYVSVTDETEPNFIGIKATMSDLINNNIEIPEEGESIDLC